jgi:ATP-binding cassette, subfamily B, multidrug efflux pump
VRSLLRLLPYFKRHRNKYIFGLILVTLSSAATAFMPRFVGKGITAIEQGTATTSLLLEYGLMIVALQAISGYFFYLVRQNIIVASREIEFDLRNDFLSHIEKLSMRFFQNTPPGEVMAYATNDVNAVRNFLGPAIMYTADTITTFLFVLTFMLFLSPILTLAILAPLPLMSVGVYLIGRKVTPLADQVQAQYADMSTRATESISGTKVVKAYVREDYEEHIFGRLSEDYYNKNMRLAKVQGLMMPVIFGFMGLSVVILLLLGGPMFADKRLSLGDLTQFVIYLGMLAWPFIALGWVTNMIQRSAASMIRLGHIFDLQPDIKDINVNGKDSSIKGEIEFRNVSFKYREELPFVLKNISVHVAPGKTLAIIGKTGAGKTTLIDLIPRLYDTTEGEILIDGINIRAIPLTKLRTSIGMVAQESFLFSEPLRDNIAFGTGKLTESEIVNVARVAELHKDVGDFPQGYDTIVGERGITLSGGQKQRTSLARAVARDPQILILDDALSAVDTATEEKILSNLRQIMRKRTSIIISHRISTVKEADEIIVLADGAVSERGTHNSLLAHRGWYYELYQKQLLEEALEQA